MEIKKVTKDEIRQWWNELGRRDNAMDYVVDFARDHGILKEPVRKWRWVMRSVIDGRLIITDMHHADRETAESYYPRFIAEQCVISTQVEE